MTEEERTGVEAEHTLELYKLALERLTFQDEYLFKFSTVFLTAHGALAVLCRPPLSKAPSLSYEALAGISTVGFALAVIWCLWVYHNDYWHSVWVGAIRDIEKNLTTSARLFNANHSQLALSGGRSSKVMCGHGIALLIPVAVAVGWGIVALYAWVSIPQRAQLAVQGDVSAFGGAAP